MRRQRPNGAMAEYFHVAEWRILEWERDYAPLNVRQELVLMNNWLEANPRRRKKNYARFIINWLNKSYASVAAAQVASRAYARVGENREPSARALAALKTWETSQ